MLSPHAFFSALIVSRMSTIWSCSQSRGMSYTWWRCWWTSSSAVKRMSTGDMCYLSALLTDVSARCEEMSTMCCYDLGMFLTWQHCWLTSAPAVRRMSTMCRWPCQQAESRALLFPPSRLFTSAPFSSSTCIQFRTADRLNGYYLIPN